MACTIRCPKLGTNTFPSSPIEQPSPGGLMPTGSLPRRARRHRVTRRATPPWRCRGACRGAPRHRTARRRRGRARWRRCRSPSRGCHRRWTCPRPRSEWDAPGRHALVARRDAEGRILPCVEDYDAGRVASKTPSRCGTRGRSGRPADAANRRSGGRGRSSSGARPAHRRRVRARRWRAPSARRQGWAGPHARSRRNGTSRWMARKMRPPAETAALPMGRGRTKTASVVPCGRGKAVARSTPGLAAFDGDLDGGRRRGDCEDRRSRRPSDDEYRMRRLPRGVRCGSGGTGWPARRGRRP